MKKLFISAVALLTFAACSKESEPQPQTDPVALSVTADISQSVTRASYDTTDPNKATFANGDEIRVVAGGSTYTYKKQQSGVWSADAPYYFQNPQEVSFNAWYTTAAANENSVSIDMTSEEAQEQGTTAWNQWDILTATGTASVSAPTVKFTFKHIMSQVKITFKAGDGIADLTKLSEYKLKEVVVGGTFTGNDITLKPDSEKTGDIYERVKDATGTTHDCTPVILIPQTQTQIALEVTYNGEKYTAALNVHNSKLEEGYSYTYTVTINNTGLVVSECEITDWQTPEGFDGSASAGMATN